MILRQLPLFLSLEKWRPAIASESSVSRDCYWSWKGWSSPSELVLHDSLWSRPRSKILLRPSLVPPRLVMIKVERIPKKNILNKLLWPKQL